MSGPNICLLYVNDLASNVPLYKYVDDSTLFEICNTTDVSVMQESIDSAVNWTNNNCMKINSNKSKKMVICFTPDENFRNSIPSIVIDGNIVETVVGSCLYWLYPLNWIHSQSHTSNERTNLIGPQKNRSLLSVKSLKLLDYHTDRGKLNLGFYVLHGVDLISSLLHNMS